MRRNPDAESFQEIFDPESLIWKANRLHRLEKTFSLPAEGVFSTHNISKHCGEELELALLKNKFESSLSEVILDTSSFEFSHTNWSLEISESVGGIFGSFSD